MRRGPPNAGPGSTLLAEESASGRTIGTYRILEELGRGGMGVVYVAEDLSLGRKVAIKALPGHLTGDSEGRERLRREARAAAALTHPGIATVFSLEEHRDEIFIIAEYIRGRTLRQVLQSGPIPAADVRRIAVDIARALDAAHRVGIVHRDLKPENIMQPHDGGIKILDFGLARLESSAADTDVLKLTQTGVVMGTPAYMSPEQLHGDTLDFRTDLFSFGIVLYELATGTHPFERGSSVATLARLMAADYVPLTESADPEVRRLQPVVELCLMKDPAARFESTSAMLRALEKLDSGAPSTPTPLTTRREAERRHVTVLVCGSTGFQSDAFVDNVDLEDQADLLKQFRSVCDEAIRRFGGSPVEWSGNRLRACFGYPVAHEDDASRAVRAAMRVRSRSADIDHELSRHSLALEPWFVIHTGAAVTEMQDGAISIVGEARDVACRLEAAARPGQIVCSSATQQLLKGVFATEDLGSPSLGGSTQAVEVFAVEGSRDGAYTALDAQSELTPLTGRDHELGLLVERWQQAREGLGQVVFLVGEPGLGKSRLVYTLQGHVKAALQAGEDSFVVEWRCSPHYQNSSLHPAIDFYERFLEFDARLPARDRFERLLRHLQDFGLARPDVVPLFMSLLSLPHDERYPPLGLSAMREKEETLRVLHEWLRAVSSRRPVLFIVEDLHWVDPSTLEFVSQLVSEDCSDDTLALLTFRPEFKTPWPAMAHQTALALNRLTRQQVGDMVRRRTGNQALPDALISQVYDRTCGVPLFVEEFTKMAQESGVLGQVDHDSGRTRALIARAIPATLQDLVMARLDRIEGSRDVAQLAATIGREFTYDLIAAAATLDEPTLQAELGRLVDAEIVYPKGRPPRCGYMFKHALLEDAAYNSLVKSKRLQFHRQIAEALEARFPMAVEKQPEVIAHHFTEAGLTERGVAYWLKAGLRSRERSANVEAIAHLTKGLTMLPLLPDSGARQSMEVQFLSALGTANISARGYGAPEVGPIFTRAHALCREIGDARQLFAIIWGSWAWSLVRGDVRGGLALAEEGMELATRLADPGMLMEALFLPAASSFFHGDFRAALDHSGKALAEYDDRDRIDGWRALTGEDSGVAHRAYHALALWHLGFPDRALAMTRDMIALARHVGHPFTLAFALEHATWVYQHCRLGAEASRCAEEEIAIAAEEGFTYWHASGTAFKAGAMVLLGGVEDAVATLGGAMTSLRASGSEIANPYRFSVLADACTRGGRYADARQALDQGLAVVEKNDDRCYEAELHRLKGELLLAQSPEDVEEAEQCFRRAIDVSRLQQSRGWELRSAMSLARLWNRQARRQDAREALATVFETFEEGFATPDLSDAASLLATLK